MKEIWWTRGKREIVMELTNTVLSKNTGKIKIIDFSCGRGPLLQYLLQYGEVTGTYFPKPPSEFGEEDRIDLHFLDLSSLHDPWDTFDFGVMLDVLEHIKTDSIAAKNLYSFMKPGGTCIVTVPAYQWLYSSHDEMVGHHRRYNKKTLKQLLLQAGFEIEYISYYNSLLFPAALIERLVSKCSGKWLKFDKASADEEVNNRYLDNLLYQIFRSEKGWISKRHSYPYGLSLIAVIKRPNV